MERKKSHIVDPPRKPRQDRGYIIVEPVYKQSSTRKYRDIDTEAEPAWSLPLRGKPVDKIEYVERERTRTYKDPDYKHAAVASSSKRIDKKTDSGEKRYAAERTSGSSSSEHRHHTRKDTRNHSEVSYPTQAEYQSLRKHKPADTHKKPVDRILYVERERTETYEDPDYNHAAVASSSKRIDKKTDSGEKRHAAERASDPSSSEHRHHTRKDTRNHSEVTSTSNHAKERPGSIGEKLHRVLSESITSVTSRLSENLELMGEDNLDKEVKENWKNANTNTELNNKDALLKGSLKASHDKVRDNRAITKVITAGKKKKVSFRDIA